MRISTLALLNLIRRPVTTAIALLSIAISIACAGVLFKLYLLSGSRFSSLGAGGDAIVGAKAGGIEILLGSLNGEGEYPGFIPDKLFHSLREGVTVHFEDGAQTAPRFVRAVIPILYFGEVGGFRAIGTDTSFFTRVSADEALPLAEGHLAQAGEFVLGSEVARELVKGVGDDVIFKPWSGSTGSVAPEIKFRVAGILRSTGTSWDRNMYSDLSDAQSVLARTGGAEHSIWKSEVLNYFLVYLEPGGFEKLSSLINARTVAQAVSVEEAKSRLEEITGSGRKLGLVVTLLILVIGSLSVAGVLIARFEAMRMQIAILRAIGYGREEVGLWLLLEGLFMGLSACVLGAIFDLAVFPLIRNFLGQALPANTEVPIYASFPVWIAALVAVTAAVMIPLVRVYRLDVHSALREL